MLRVQDVHVLRHKILVEGKSQRAVARELGVSRNTVRRYLTLAEPVRVEREPRRKPVLERVQPRLDALLEEWSGRTTAKQRLTATRLHRQLREEGYRVGETLVGGARLATEGPQDPSATASTDAGKPLARSPAKLLNR